MATTRSLINAEAPAQAVTAGKNAVINGGFDVWQRGTSGTANATAAGSGYNADRWWNYYAGSMTVSRQATGDTTNLPNIQYCARIQRNSGQTSATTIYHGQDIETSNSIQFAGKVVTISFYARAGANFSAASSVLSANAQTGTGTDQHILAGYTGGTTYTSNVTINTTWQRFTYSFVAPTNTTQLGLYFLYNAVGTAGAADYFEITGVQLEAGSIATPFSRAGGTIQGELAACQRYYCKSYDQATTPGTATSTGTTYTVYGASNTGAKYQTTFFPVVMRGTPTMQTYDLAGTAGKVYAGGNGGTAAYTSNGQQSFSAGIAAGTAALDLIYSWTASAEL